VSFSVSLTGQAFRIIIYLYKKTSYLSKNIQGSFSKLAQSILLQRRTKKKFSALRAHSVPPNINCRFPPLLSIQVGHFSSLLGKLVGRLYILLALISYSLFFYLEQSYLSIY